MQHKRIKSAVLAVVLAVSVFLPLNTVYAADNNGIVYFNKKYNALGEETVDFCKTTIDADAFKAILLPAIKEKADYVDVSQFKIPSAQVSNLNEVVWYNIPEAFNVYSLGTSISNGIVTRLWIYYNDVFDDYDNILAVCEKEAEMLLYGIKDNRKLGDIEKILLIHDRLDQYCEYDYANYLDGSVSDESFEMVGVFVNQKAVCAGYTKAFKFLLDKVGIENYYISSDEINHAWNVVYLDGVPYFTDSTWDDPIWDRCGRVQHINFMQSSDAFALAHDATDYDRIPVDTKYDDMYWYDIDTAFQLVGDYIYYLFVDASTRMQTLYRSPCSTIVDRSDDTAVLTFSAKWYVAATSFYTYTSYLCSDGRALYYNMTDHINGDVDNIIKYDPATGKTSVFYEVPKETMYDHAYGFYYDGRTLSTDVYNSPNISSRDSWESAHHEITLIDHDTCGKGNHLPVAVAKGYEGTCANPASVSSHIVCYACEEVLQNSINYSHSKNTSRIEYIAPDYLNAGVVSAYCSCGKRTDININSLACRDLDRNGDITTSDYSYLVNAALSMQNDSANLYNFDIDSDGAVDVIDVVLFERVMHEAQKPDLNFCVQLTDAHGKTNTVAEDLAWLLAIPVNSAAEIVSDGSTPLLNGVDFEYAYRFVSFLKSKGIDAAVIYDGCAVC